MTKAIKYATIIVYYKSEVERKMENNKSKGLMLKNNKPLVITVCTVAAILLVILGIFLVIELTGGEEEDALVVETIEGVYSMSAGEGGSSEYTLNKDGTGKCVYASADSLEPITEEFTYEIAGTGNERKITITSLKTGEKNVHTFADGTRGTIEFIEINGVTYYKK